MTEPTVTAATSVGSFHAIKRHLIALMAAVLLALAYFSFSNLLQSLEARERASRVSAWTDTTVILSNAAHALQRERGLSSGHLASGGRRFEEALQSQHAVTDAVLEPMIAALPGQSLKIGGQSLSASGIRALIHDTRWAVTSLQISRDAVVARYSEVIEALLALMQARSGDAGELLRSQLAFISYLHAKEMAGQERALLTAILSSGNFGYFSRMAGFHRIRATEETFINQFLLLTDEQTKDQYLAMAKPDYMRELENIRRHVVAVGHSGTQPATPLPSAERWFELSSKRIDAMKNYEDTLSRAIQQAAKIAEARARQELLINGLSVAGAFLVALLLVYQFRRGRRYAESGLRLADKVFSASVESILVTDAESRIVEVNAAFSRITGYSRDEVLGQHSRLMKSGRHGPEFYAAMWQRVAEAGSWEGEIWNRRKNGDIYPALLSVVALKDDAGKLTNYIAMSIDLSQHKKTEALLNKLRTFDALTGLLGRDAWGSAIDRAVAGARGSTRQFAILDVGLDRFKLINDSLTHAVGDKVLVEAAIRIRRVLRRHDAAARPGGDRFSLLLEDIESVQNTTAICEKLLAAFVPPFHIDGHTLHVSVSVGAALFPGDGETPSTLQRNAETAMYRAKGDGRATYSFYSAEMNEEGVRLLTLETMLRQALVKGEFSVVYQPQVEVTSGHLVGVEALLRWTNPQLGSVSPVQFIPIAEETGLIVPIGDWVLETACRQGFQWLQTFGVGIPVAVNLSARQFRKQDLLVGVQSVLDAVGLPSELLELEITEGSLISDPTGAVDVLRGIRAMGVRTAIDDFGTGYSSLAYLKTFPLDRLKIDRAFVRDLPDNASDVAIALAVVTLGRNLKMEVLAEGVETEAQSRFLAQAGCQVIQGYFYGKPMTPEQLSDKIRNGEFRLPPAQTHQEKRKS